MAKVFLAGKKSIINSSAKLGFPFILAIESTKWKVAK